MSSTRKSRDNFAYHQNRYASSPEFGRGLLGNLVAKRCDLIESRADRELVWFIQCLSHREGGVAGLAEKLLEKNANKIQTEEMAQMKLKAGKICAAEQVKKIREGLPECWQQNFLLKGEAWDYQDHLVRVARKSAAWDENGDLELDQSTRLPASYEANRFFELCRHEAESSLEKELSEICLNPASSLSDGPWYFPGLISALREYQSDYAKNKTAAFTTALGNKVCDVLDYTSFSRGLTLMEGKERTGKSFAARTWCEQRPGIARFVEVPSGNDDSGFFRALARGLGLGNFLQYKACEIRDRVESVLLAGDLLLVLDEAQKLWPQRNLRYGFPGRIVWVMAMANAGVPIAMVSTPQFIQAQRAMEKTGWNSAQLTGRIKHYESLPVDLSQADLIGVAKSVLPEADSEVLRALAIYARSSARYLSAIDSISTRARYLATKEKRDMATTADIKKAMQESVIPADTKLQLALERGKKENRIRPGQQSQSLASAEYPGESREEFPRRERQISLSSTRPDQASLVEAEN